MERKNAWQKISASEFAETMKVSEEYRQFVSRCKTERECVAEAVRLAREAGYRSLEEVRKEGRILSPGDRIYAMNKQKMLILYTIGSRPLTDGMRILGAHIDSPRLDVKPNPLYEDNGICLLDTHYYGGIKKYQWVAIPMALHGVIAKKDGSVVPVVIGEDPADPVVGISDLLIHLAAAQMEKTGAKVVEGEALNVTIGSMPEPGKETAEPGAAVSGEMAAETERAAAAQADRDAGSGADRETARAAGKAGNEGGGQAGIRSYEAAGEKDGNGSGEKKGKEPEKESEKESEKEPVKKYLLKLLKEKYRMEEEDFLSAELEAVPAGPARDFGIDRSMIMGYGHDDRVCAYTSLRATMAVETPEYTSVCLLVDKEEIGSVGSTSMHSRFFENTVAELIALGGEPYSDLLLRRCMSASRMLSSDVSAGFDPNYPDVNETKNTAYMGAGFSFNKYTGSRGKGGCNDANAEYVAWLRRVMDDAGVVWQMSEIGRVDVGGGGTIAFILANYDMEVIDCGVPVHNMHAPWEVISKVDLFETMKGYAAFLSARD